MQNKWKKLFAQTVIFLASEILFNSLGLDTLADYSEFVFSKEVIIQLAVYNINI